MIDKAAWWAIVTATTVGHGDVSPVTTEGRLIAVILMLIGIGVIGVFTAAVASHFFAQDEENLIAAGSTRSNASSMCCWSDGTRAFGSREISVSESL